MDDSERDTSPIADCSTCKQAFDPERKVVYDTENLLGYVTPLYPWAVIVATRRHECEGPWALTQAEAIDLGRMIPRITQAMRKTGVERVYALAFNEEASKPHFHLGFVSRYVELSEQIHDVMYARVQSETSDAMQAAAEFAAAVRANL
ncbi:hypothetical protein A5761_01760 [Mycolicibacterium setense]|nr:hypothetical protein A5761_01760 [Mycolicibacterium setense]